MDYSKLKVTELKDLLSSRNLPVSGKKEELIARLTESDSNKPAAADDDLGDLAPPDEEYDWDTPSTKAPAKQDSKPTVPPPAAVSASIDSTVAPKRPLDAPKPSSTTTDQPAPAEAVVDPADALAVELEKRKRRAERFGIPVGDSVKALERAKRFGTTDTALSQESKKKVPGQPFANQVWKKNGENKKPAQAQQKTPKSPEKKVLDDPVEAEKAKKRAERFGGGNEAKKVKS